LVVASTLGYSMSTMMALALGLFIEPMSRELGWTRTEISAGFTLAMVAPMLLAPFVGAAIDRWGARRLALPGIVLSAFAIAAFGLVQSVPQWLALWVIYSLVALGIQLTVWTVTVSSVFSAGRGLALACTVSGTALSAIVVPPIAFRLIELFGWRHAFAWLGFGWALPTLLMSLFFLFDRRDRARIGKDAAGGSAVDLPGLTIAQAIRSVALWRIGLSTLLIITVSGALVVHQVPILVDAGVARGKAAMLASLSGFAGLAGKIVTGWLMDRMPAARISGVTFGASAIGFALLLEPLRSPATIVLAIVIVGYSGGAKLQVSSYLTSRYGGLRNFGKIFGVIASIIAMGSGLGPVLAAGAFDLSGSYAPFLIGGIPGFLISAVLIYGLGPYPDFEEPEIAVPAAEPIAAAQP
jgi:MFS family permease